MEEQLLIITLAHLEKEEELLRARVAEIQKAMQTVRNELAALDNKANAFGHGEWC